MATFSFLGINYISTSPTTAAVDLNPSATGTISIPTSATDTGTSITYTVTSIGNNAFENCSGLTSVTIPNSVTSIGDSAFENCSGLTSVTIPNSVTSIGNYAFYACSGLTSVTIPNSVTSIGNYAFYACSGLTSVTIPNSVTIIGDSAFEACFGLTSVTIPNSVTIIGDSAFNSCNNLTLLIIPNSVISIGNIAFSNCTGLTSVTIGSSVTTIGNAAFSNCIGLTSVTIPNSVTSIGNNTFRLCSGLTTITIGNSVTTIGNSAFEDCGDLTSVICNIVTPLVISADVFAGVAQSACSLKVPTAASVAAYQAASVWTNFNPIITDVISVNTVVDSPTQVTVNFSDPTNGTGATQYNIYVLPSGSPEPTISTPTSATVPVAPSPLLATVSGLMIPNATYDIWVLSINGPNILLSGFDTIRNPDPPGVTAVANSPTQVTVTITPPTNTGGSAIAQYDVITLLSTDPTPLPIAPTGTIVSAGPNIITGLLANTTYSFYVRATNSDGYISLFGSANATTLGNPDPPGVTAVANSPTQVTVTITPPTNTGGSAIIQYDVITLPAGSPAPVPIAPTGTIVFAGPNIITGLSPATSYDFYVRARNSDGYSSGFGSASATTPDNPAAPGVTAVAISPTQVTISITAPTYTGGSAIAQYDVIVLLATLPAPSPSDPPGIIVPAGPTTIPGLLPNTAYTFYVRATNNDGYISLSFGEANATTLTEPEPIPIPSPICYTRGTLIATSRGMVAIEDLLMSDKLRTYGRIEESIFEPVHGVPIRTLTRVKDTRIKNRFAGIKFIGKFTVNSMNENTAPIRITKSALGHLKPERDLLVSPNHSILVGDRLIFAKNLVNESTIYQDMSFNKIEYFHVLSDDHYVINANGTLSETLGSEEIAIFEALHEYVEAPTKYDFNTAVTNYDFSAIHIKEEVEFDSLPEYSFTEMVF